MLFASGSPAATMRPDSPVNARAKPPERPRFPVRRPPSSRSWTGVRAARSKMSRDAGMVTVEAAIGLSAVIVAFLLVLGGVAAVIGQLRCTDAAVEAARLAARGEQHRAAEVVTSIAPNGARVELTVTDGNVTTNVRSPLPGGFLPGLVLSAEAFAVLEPGVSEQGGESGQPGGGRDE